MPASSRSANTITAPQGKPRRSQSGTAGNDEEEKREEMGYLRREVRYGSVSRSLPLPEGVTEADITASCKDGVLEIRIPEPKHEEANKIAISES